MNLPRLTASLLVAGALTTSGFSQAVPASPSAPEPQTDVVPVPSNEPRPDDPVTLSPFTVNTDRDEGYRAQSTLAGSRLNTPLKDLGASISVYTKDFLTDIGATNVSDLFVFATNMEAGGSQGNFSGVGNGIGDAEVVGDGPRTNPQSGSRTRGLTAPSFTRGYYVSDIPIDGYNTNSITVNRGANAVLFGIGSPAGVVDTSLLQADLNRDRGRIEHRFGDNSSSRSILEVNKVLIPKKLAVRLAGLDDQENYDQRPSFEDKSRVYGSAVFRPFAATTVRASFETGKTRANRPITVLPFNSINQFWEAAGRPAYDWTVFDDPAKRANAAALNAGTSPANRPYYIGQAQIFSAIVIPYQNNNGVTGPQTSFRSSVPTTNITGGGSLAANALRTQLFHPTLNRDTALDGISFYETFNIGEGALSSAVFPGGVRPAGIKMQGFTDYSAFAFNKRQIDETSRQTEDFRTFNVSLEQLFWKDERGVERAGVELGYNFESFERFSNNAFFSQGNGNHIRIDPNVTLPDGRPNPNVGRPYASGSAAATLSYYESERETARATAFLRHDFKDTFEGVGKWLGRHTLTALYEEYEVSQMDSATRYRMFGQAAEAISVTPTGFNRLPNAVVYLGDPILDGRDLQLSAIRIQPITSGQTTNTSWFRAPLGSATQGDIAVTESTIVEGIEYARPRRNVTKSQAFVLQSYWLDDLFISTIGWRKDEDYGIRLPDRTYNTDPLRLRFSLSEVGLPSTPPFNEAVEVLSSSFVLRWPQKLIRLPRGVDASIFFNKSENSIPDSSRISAENVRIASSSGTTDEFGFSLSAFHDKLNLRVNRYETSQVNASRSGTYGSAINNFYRQLASFWDLQSNSTPQFDRSADVEKLLNALPATKALLNHRRVVDPVTGTVSSVQNVLPAFSDTQDFISKGTEVEVVYNPTRQWRIAVNVAKQETVLSNLAPGARSAIEKLIPVWNEFKDTPRANATDWQGPGVPYPTTAGEHLGNQVRTTVLVPYYTLLAQEGVASAEQRKWRANVVTNYTFARSGLLKGFGVGTGVRWQDKYALGYPTSYAANGSVLIDIENPYWSDDDWNVDAWVSYSRKIYRDKINWKVQLNVRNLIGSEDPIAINVQPDGSPAVTRLPPEKRIYLTNTFEF